MPSVGSKARIKTASPELTQLLMTQKSSIQESLKIVQSLRQSEHHAQAEQEVLENQTQNMGM